MLGMRRQSMLSTLGATAFAIDRITARNRDRAMRARRTRQYIAADYGLSRLGRTPAFLHRPVAHAAITVTLR
jgi:hypothetical protein